MAITIQHTVHVNLNCNDHEQHKTLLTKLGFSPASRLQPDPQDGQEMGIEGQVQWDGYAMVSGLDWQSAMIDLLTFRLPPIIGQSYEALNHIGNQALIIAVDDVEATHHALRAETLSFLGPLQTAKGTGFHCRDHDGIRYDIIDRRIRRNKQSGLAGLVVNCSDIHTTQAWYQDHLGFVSLSDAPEKTTLFTTAFDCNHDIDCLSLKLSLAQRDDFIIRLQQPEGIHGQSYSVPNHVGLYRTAFAVEDIHQCYDHLQQQGVDCPHPPVYQDMGPGIPVDGVWALYFFDPDGNCIELIETPTME